MSRGLGKLQREIIRYTVSEYGDFLNGIEVKWLYRLLGYHYKKPSIARGIKSLERHNLIIREEHQTKDGHIGENATDYLMPYFSNNVTNQTLRKSNKETEPNE